MLGGQVFHDLAELALEPLRTQSRRLLQESANVVRLESKQSELGGELLLAKPVGQLLGGPASLLRRRGRSCRLVCIHIRLSPKPGLKPWAATPLLSSLRLPMQVAGAPLAQASRETQASGSSVRLS